MIKDEDDLQRKENLGMVYLGNLNVHDGKNEILGKEEAMAFIRRRKYHELKS